MEFRLLGPVEVRSARGEVIRLKRRQERLALAVLLLEPHRVVTAERLVELLWDDTPPPTATTTLRTLMSRVRTALAAAAGGEADPPARLVARGGGYLLRVSPESIDLHRFGALVDEARAIAEPDLRSARLAAALALWRGPALADAVAGAVRDRLCGSVEELRFLAISDRIDADLAAGRHAELVAELSGLVVEHPLRERLHAQLMVALHRCGRRADALDAYRRARRVLVAELGLEPGTQLRALEASIIADTEQVSATPGDKASTATTPVVPAQLPPGLAGFVGRSVYVRRLDALLAGPHAATGPTIGVVTGAAGVGKTTLAVHWARQSAHWFPDGQLFVNMRGFHTGARMLSTEALPLLLRALGVATTEIPVDLNEQSALFRSLLAGRRVLIILDNVVDADQVRPLIPGAPGCLVLVTSRDRLSGLLALDGAHRLTLDVLPADDAVEVLAGVAGAERIGADRDAALELASLCGGLPLALRIAGARLADRPHLSIRRQAEELAARGPVAGLRVDGDDSVTVRGAFDLSYQALSAGAGRVFRSLGLVPAPAGLATAAVASLAGLPSDDVAPLTDELTRFHLVKITGAARVVCHDLLLEYAARLADHDVPADREGAIDRLLGFYLHTADGAATVLNGRPRMRLPLVPPPAGVSTMEFPEEAQARQWIATEWANLVAALDYAAASGRHRLVWQLTHVLRDFMRRQAPLTQWMSIAQTGLAAAQRAGDPLGEAAMRLGLGSLQWRTAEFQAAIEEYDVAGALSQRAGWKPGQSVALCNTGIMLAQLGKARPAIRRFERSLALDRETGDRTGEAAALTNLAAAYEQIGDLSQAARFGEAALPLLRQTGQRWGEAIALENIAAVRREQARFGDAIDAVERALRIHRSIGAEHEEAAALVTLGLVHRDTGRYDEAMAVLTAALDIAHRLSDRRVEILSQTGIAAVEVRQGHLVDAAKRLGATLDIAERTDHRPGKIEALLTLSEVHAAQDEHESASACAVAALDLSVDSGYVLAVARARSLLAAGRIGLGDPAGGLDLCRRALMRQRAAGQRLAQARTLRVMGDACQALGKARLAESRRRAARALLQEIGAPLAP